MDLVVGEAVEVFVVVIGVGSVRVGGFVGEVGELACVFALVEGFQVVERGELGPETRAAGVRGFGVDIAVVDEVLTDLEHAEVLVNAWSRWLVWGVLVAYSRMGSLTCWFPFYDGFEKANGFFVGPRVVENIIVGGLARRLRCGRGRFVLIGGCW